MTFDPNAPIQEFVPPTHATVPKITLGDLQATLTVEQVIELIEQVVSVTRDHIEATIEHWTDDDGLHWTPFQNDLDSELPGIADNEAFVYLTNNRII